MTTHDLNRVKRSLLRELDTKIQGLYHQPLRDVINDLRMHYFEVRPDPSPDEVFTIVQKSRILDFATDARLTDLREALDRAKKGSLGFCVNCGVEIPADLLEKDPAATLCASCSRTYTQASEALKGRSTTN